MARGRPFQAGNAGGPGRPKGPLSVEAKTLCCRIVDDPDYFENLKTRALAGELPPQIEAMLWHYAKGVPKQRFEHTGPNDGPIAVVPVSQLTDHQLDVLEQVLTATAMTRNVVPVADPGKVQ